MGDNNEPRLTGLIMTTTSPVFNKGALITTITPAPSCYSSGWIGTAWAYSFGTYPTTSVNYHAASGCLPYHTGIGHLFSPGICPGGWTTALMSTARGVVTAQCCPTGYDKYNGDGAGAYCRSVRSESLSIDCAYPTSTGGSRQPCVPTLIGPGAGVIFAYTIAYESTDLSRFPSGYTPGTIGDAGGTPLPSFDEHTPGVVITAPAMPTPTSPTSPGPPSTPSASPGQTSGFITPDIPGGLTTGAKAGIGVGAAIGALLLLGAILFCLRRRRRNKGDTAQGGTNGNRDDEKEVIGDDRELTYYKGVGVGSQELDGRATGYVRNELDGAATKRVVEADSYHHAGAELPGEQQQRWQELPSERAPTFTPHQSEATHQHAFNTNPGPYPANDTMSATALGPVSTAWDASHQGGYVDRTDSSTHVDTAQSQQVSPVPATQTAQQHPETIEEVELRYLENEERRIRERKEALLASRRQ